MWFNDKEAKTMWANLLWDFFNYTEVAIKLGHAHQGYNLNDKSLTDQDGPWANF